MEEGMVRMNEVTRFSEAEDKKLMMLQGIADVNEPKGDHDMETVPDNEPRPARIKSATNEPQPGSSNIANLPNKFVSQATSSILSPEAIKPLPKAPPRSCVTTKRRIRKSAILTDTPEKNALAEEKQENFSKRATAGNFLMSMKEIQLGKGAVIYNENEYGRLEWKRERYESMNEVTKKLFSEAEYKITDDGDYMRASPGMLRGMLNGHRQNEGHDSPI
ncbi:hypothetical protein JTB14_023013 [Gonioctena quinquepunctata]|nr:hypothetical protein JTB14_023013 [Gonioctena quinquepunctata]